MMRTFTPLGILVLTLLIVIVVVLGLLTMGSIRYGGPQGLVLRVRAEIAAHQSHPLSSDSGSSIRRSAHSKCTTASSWLQSWQPAGHALLVGTSVVGHSALIRADRLCPESRGRASRQTFVSHRGFGGPAFVWHHACDPCNV